MLPWKSDHIWRNFATLVKFYKYKYLAIFLRVVNIWQHFEPTLAIFTIGLG